ncbi:MAG TPA: hypothetical protein VHB50_07770 [Bryobacteraceae bacterium]|nr:hypothetical protein [Bryobacteraceae bacterium]
MPIVFITLAIIEASLGAWQFFTMQYAIETVGRYVSTHGRGCTQNGNNCALTVGDVATMIEDQARALEPSRLDIVLTTATSTQTCSPVTTCVGNSAQFPSSTDNGVNQDILIQATYPVASPLPLYWPGGAPSNSATVTLGATTRQRIQF